MLSEARCPGRGQREKLQQCECHLPGVARAGCLLELLSFRTFGCVWRKSSLQSGRGISSSFSLKVLRTCFPNSLATGAGPSQARHELRSF